MLKHFGKGTADVAIEYTLSWGGRGDFTFVYVYNLYVLQWRDAGVEIVAHTCHLSQTPAEYNLVVLLIDASVKETSSCRNTNKQPMMTKKL